MADLPKLSDIRETAADREGSLLARDREFVALTEAIKAVLFGVGSMGSDAESSFDHGFNTALRAVREAVAKHIDVEG